MERTTINNVGWDAVFNVIYIYTYIISWVIYNYNDIKRVLNNVELQYK